MQVTDAQREVREVYLGGSVGQLVSGALWLAAAAAGTWGSTRLAMAVLLLGGILIFPVTTGVLKGMGRRAALSPENPLGGLAMQVAFTVPLGLLVALAAAGHRREWFFPACMLIVGAHYLPFVFLYGMRTYALLAALMCGGGIALALYGPPAFTLGGWLTGGVLVAFAIVLRAVSVERAG
jgi:hypothetical protein